jgi:hypothetical protein
MVIDRGDTTITTIAEATVMPIMEILIIAELEEEELEREATSLC